MSLLSLARTVLKSAGVDTTRAYQSLSAASIRAALREQKLDSLARELRRVVPDLTGQYTHGFDTAEYERYWEIKMRGLHAFQVRLALDALERIEGTGLILADIGDSSGNHAAYIHALAGSGKVAKTISVNLDPVAVDKIRAKGGEAIHCRAEELDLKGISPDLILSFETIEHLTDPLRFLHSLATKGSAEYLLMTVPYRRLSRFGGEFIRRPEDAMPERLTAEDVHIFELSPGDWTLLARFAGFRCVFSRTYLQYPRFHPLRLTGRLWRKLDFEGFFGMFLVRDPGLADRYVDW